MITHIVLFKLNEMSLPERAAVRQELKQKLEALKERVSVVVQLDVHVNELHEEKNYDLMLFSRFRSAEDLETYRVHPAHQEVVARIAQVAASRAAIDFHTGNREN
ncbi:MAG: Dabb family protein [Prolixibacteraceae bacterium]|nr:Dabb family protein [Prolixibacteraceae bacterium]HRV88817.1 Dabb family protein [Prolixibacteraceae bacterium]